MKKWTRPLIGLASMAVSLPLLAESNIILPAVSGSVATARLDFAVDIPPVLYLRVGTGNAIGAANNTTINGISFSVASAAIGNGVSINASAGSGDLGNGGVTVRIFSNVGTDVRLNSSVTGQLRNAAGDTIAWSQVSVAAAALPVGTPGYTNGPITHPAFSATAGAGTPTQLTAVGKLVMREGRWTYSYSNTVTPVAGTYGSTVANHGRVTYTALQL